MSEITHSNAFQRETQEKLLEIQSLNQRLRQKELVMICTEGFHSKNSLVLKLNGMESKDIELGKFSTKSFLDLSDFRVST